MRRPGDPYDVVVIGGGPTGVELAGAFAELRSKVLARDYRAFDPKEIQVFLIEAGPALLSGYDEKSSVYTKKRLERLGVKVFLNERVTDIDAKGVTTQEQFFSSSNIIWAAGVEGHPLAKMATDKLDPRGRILVTPELLIEGETDIFACGDMTYFGHDERFPRGLPGVAPAAMQQGQRAAKNIIALINGTETKPFEYFDKGKMATIGRSAAVAEAGRMKMRGFLAWCAWLFIHLLYLVEFQDRIIVFMRWIWSYLTWQWGVRIIFDASDADSGQIVSASSSEPSDTNSTGQTSQTESPSNLSEDKQADTTVTQESNVDKELPPDPQVKQPHDLSSSDESAAEEEPPVDAVDEIETEAPSSTRDENDLKATATESS